MIFQCQEGPGLYLPPPREEVKPREGPREDHGGHHGDSDDPLGWLRDSIPGISRQETDGHFSIGNLEIKICKIERKPLSYRDHTWDLGPWDTTGIPLGYHVVSSHSD